MYYVIVCSNLKQGMIIRDDFFLIQGLRILARFRLLLQMILLTTEWARSYLPLDKSHRSDSGMIL